MTYDQLKSMRALCEAATRGIWDSAVWTGSNEDSWTATGPIHTFGDDPYEPNDPESETAKRAERDSAFIAAASPDVIIALLDQLSTLEKHVANNDDEYRTMKEVLRAEHQERERLRGQLSAMTAARDEACDIAERLHGKIQTVSTVDYGGVLQRIAVLRKVGQ